MGSFHCNLACTLFPGVTGLNLTKGHPLNEGCPSFLANTHNGGMGKNSL